MHRRLVAAVAAIMLAVVGAVLLMSYVAAADSRAMAGMEITQVLVVAESVPAGTQAADVAELVALEELPAKAVAPGALTSLDQVEGQTVTDLEPGEQLLVSRFATPEPDSGPEVPAGMHEVSVLLESQRVIGSNLVPGDTVAVFITKNSQTHLTLHKVLVTRVQGGLTPPEPTEASGQAEPAPTPTPAPGGSVMVTIALSAPDAEKVVWAQEHGSVWLSLEPTDAPEKGTRVVTEENVYE